LAQARATRQRAAATRSAPASPTGIRGAPARTSNQGRPSAQHDGAAPRQDDPQSELDTVLDLQQAYGNLAVLQLLAAGGHGAPPPVLPNSSALGNRAVVQLLSASRTAGPLALQRAPSDDEDTLPALGPKTAGTNEGTTGNLGTSGTQDTTARRGSGGTVGSRSTTRQDPPPAHRAGAAADSDLPRNPDGTVASPRFSTGKGIPKLGSKEVRTEDAVVSPGVGSMFAPIKKNAYKTVGQPGEGTSESYILEDRTTRQRFLFKPIVGEPNYDFAHARGVGAGHYAERARAGSIAASVLGISTPEVRLVSINGRKGSLTPWVQPKGGGQVMSLADFALQDEARFNALQKTPEFKQALSGIQALDYLINNLDRVNNTGNYLIELDDKQRFKALIPIDQELAFTHTSDRAIIPLKTGQMPDRWTPELADKVAKLHENPGEFIRKIRPLVGDAALDGVMARLSDLHADGVRKGAIRPPGAPGSPAAGAAPGQGGTGSHPLPAAASETPIADDEPEPTPAPARAKTGSTSATPTPPASGGEASSSAVGGHGSPAAGPESPAPDPASVVELPSTPAPTTTTKRKVKANPLGGFKAKDPSLGGYHSERTTETIVGKDEYGEDVKKTNESKTNLDVNFKGVEAGKDVSHTTAGGTKVGAGVHGSMDWEGNTSAVGSLTFETRSGLSISPSVGHSDQADASDPQYVEGVGFVVTYKLSSSDNYGVGGGKSLGGGTSASVNVGHSEAKYRSGSRIFKKFEEANAFRDNVRRETQRSIFQPPPTTVMGALQIPMGESRGGGTAKANTIGGSLSYGEGLGDIGYSHVATSNEEVSVMRTGPTTVDVTRTFSEDTTKDPHIGGFGFSNTKGKSEETGRAVTYTFDLATPNGIAAFNRWASQPDAPGAGATNRRTKTFKQANAHDDYGMPVKFSASWKDRKWESKEEDEAGNVTETFGGGQDRDTRTGRVAEFLGDREQHANAQIEATIKNGQESYAARFTVSGKSGDSNLEELGKMFMGARHDAGDSSGYWLLTAQIDPLVVKELERNNKAFRNAKTPADRMRIYSDYARENGARMLSGQVRSGSKPLAWNLELPGDPNFPGAAGRTELEDKQKSHRDKLGTDRTSGGAVADDAKQTLAKLKDRRSAVADTKRYTDLPDELRQEQVALVDDHIAKFEGVRSQSNSLAMRNDPNEDIATIRARTAEDAKPAKTKAARSAAKGAEKRQARKPAPSADQLAADAKLSPDQKEIRKLSDRIAIKEQDIATFAGRVEAANKVLSRMMSKSGGVRMGEGVKGSVWRKYNAEAKEHLANARARDKALKASAAKARELRIQWQDTKEDPARLVALRALDAELGRQRDHVDLELDMIRDATRSAYVVTSDYGIGKDWEYFKAIKCDSELRANAINTASGQIAEDEL
jgi:hypothetical protein